MGKISVSSTRSINVTNHRLSEEIGTSGDHGKIENKTPLSSRMFWLRISQCLGGFTFTIIEHDDGFVSLKHSFAFISVMIGKVTASVNVIVSNIALIHSFDSIMDWDPINARNHIQIHWIRFVLQ